MLDKLRIHLLDSIKIGGDIIDFRIYDGLVFCDIVNAVGSESKRIIGFESFSGLGEPNQVDLLHPNYNEIKKGQYFSQEPHTRSLIAKNAKYGYEIYKTDYVNINIPLCCFAIVDLKQYTPTKNILNLLWEQMNYGGTLFIPSFDPSQNHSQHAALKEFLLSHADDINVSRQMVVNGSRERFIAVKCFNEKYKPSNYKQFHIKEKITIATVLKTGGDTYNHRYVNALAKAIKNNVTVDHELVCLTDNSSGFSSDVDRVLKFRYDFPKWWGKIELFNPENFNTNQVFYMDLDTSIIDNIDDIVSYDGVFAGLRDFYALHSLGSGVMAWNRHKVSHIYDRFIPRSREVINNYQGGDQVWIDENKPSIEYLQDIYHNNIVSFKRHCYVNNIIRIPDKAKIVCFHGQPRPHQVNHDILKKYWCDK